MKKKSVNNKKAGENIWNVPNTLTLLRVLITFITVYLIFAEYNIIVIVVLFSIGMLTDFFDGQIARRFNLTTEFGRKFDVVADRFLMISVALALIISYSIDDLLLREHILQIIMIMSREIIALPIAVILMWSRKGIPKVRWIGKATTALQGFTFPAIILSIHYPIFSFSVYMALITAVCGIASGLTFINDSLKSGEER